MEPGLLLGDRGLLHRDGSGYSAGIAFLHERSEGGARIAGQYVKPGEDEHDLALVGSALYPIAEASDGSARVAEPARAMLLLCESLLRLLASAEGVPRPWLGNYLTDETKQLDSVVIDASPGLSAGTSKVLIHYIAVEAGGPGTTGVGVDRDEQVLARGRPLARTRELDGRVHFVCADSATWNQRADRVLCVGASDAWAGVEQALQALARLVRPGGRVLFGEGCWERPPTPAAAAMFGQDVIALADVVRLARATGWQVLHLSTGDLREWDDFEASWRRGRQRWLLDHPQDDRAGEVQDTLDAQLQDYVEVYRGVLGFGYLVLGR